MDKKNRKIIMTASFIIPVIMVLTGFIVGGFAPFGELDVLSAGGMYEYIPYFSELHDRLRSGDSLIYSLTEGLGYNFTTIWTYYLSDPVNLIVLLFPKAAMYTVFNIIYMLKIGMAGLCFCVFLMYRKNIVSDAREKMAAKRADEIKAYNEKLAAKKSATRKSGKKDFKIGGRENPGSHFGQFLARLDLGIIGLSVAYALSSYMLGQGLNITWLGAVCIFPLIIMGLDRLIYEGRWHMFALTLTVSFYLNFYITTVISVFLILYIALHEYRDIRHFLKSLMLILVSAVITAGCAMLIILPCVKGTVFNELISLKFNTLTFNCNLSDTIKSFLISSRPSVISEYAYGIDTYCGIFVIFLLFCYAFNKNIDRISKIKNISLLVLLLLATFITTANYLFNAFFTDESMCVFGFIIIFMILSISFEAIENISFNKTINVNAAILLSAVIIITDLLLVDNYTTMTPFMLSLEVLFLYYILTLLYKNDSMTKLCFSVLIPIIMVSELSSNYVSLMGDIVDNSTQYEMTSEYAMENAASYLHAEDPYAKILFYYPEDSESTPLTNTLLGYKYVITPDTTDTVDSLLTYTENYLGVDIYENSYYIGNGFYVNDNITDWEYSSSSPFISLNLLVTDCLDGEDIFTAITGDFSSVDSAEAGVESAYNTTREIYYSFTPDVSGDIYANPSGIVHLGEYEQGEDIHFSHAYSRRDIQSRYFMLSFTTFNEDSMSELYSSLNRSDMKYLDSHSLSGSINCDDDGYVFMNIPYEKGWSCTVNGQATDIFPISGTYVGIPVSTGENVITLNFTAVYLYTGLIITILSVIIFILLSVSLSAKLRTTVYDRISAGRVTSGIATHISENRIYYLLFVIVSAIFIIMLMLHSCLPFGDNFAIVSDGLQLSYPMFYNIFEGIRNGELSLLNWSGAMVTDEYSTISIFLLNPVNYLYFLFPESASEFAFSFIYYVKLLLCSLTFVYYLTHRVRGKRMSKTSYMLIPFGLAYGLNAFVLSYFCFFTFLEVIFLVPLIILGMEKLLYEKKCVPYILLMFFLMVQGYYYAFLLCEFLLLYFFVSEFDSIRDFFMKGIRFGLSSILAAAMSGVFLIPYYIFTLSSPYKSFDSTAPEFSLATNLKNLISSFIINPYPVVVDADSTKINIYCGLLILLMIPIYLMNKNIKLSVRIRKLILALLLIYSFGNELLNYIFHGLHYQSMVPNRYSIFLIFLLITMAYDAFLNMRAVKPLTVFISGIVVSGLLIMGWTLNDNITELSFKYILSVTLLVIFIVILIVYAVRRNTKMFRKAVCVLLTVELLISSVLQFTQTFGSTLSSVYLSDIDKVNKLSSAYGMDDGMAITEYYDAPLIDMSYLAEFSSITLFSNTILQEHLLIPGEWQIVTSPNSIQYIGNPVSDMMLRVKYNITNVYYDTSWSMYEETASIDNISIHENPYYVPLGIMFDDSINEWEESVISDYDNIIEYYNAFSNALGCGDVFTEIPLEDDYNNLTDDSTYCMADMSQLTDGLGPVPIQMYISPSVGGTLYIYDGYSLLYLGEASEGEKDLIEVTLTLTEENPNYTIHLVSVNEATLQKLHEVLCTANMTDVKSGSTYMTGNINSPYDGTLYLSIPALKGFTAYVDGVETEFSEYMGGIGLELTAGRHHIELRYVIPGILPGAVLSSTAFIIFIAYIIIKRKKNISEKTVEN